MSKKVQIVISLIAAVTLSGCGGSSASNSGGDGSGSNIPYLKQNHSNYKEYGSSQIPTPKKNAAKKEISWTIEANSVEDAKKLQEHLSYMENQLKADKNPRAWDKLFLMEAYMKYNNYYTTNVERANKTIVVTKEAKNGCAYKVISAHSDAVSGDFFAQGVINKDYSSIAETILASSDCSSLRGSINNYISQRQK